MASTSCGWTMARVSFIVVLHDRDDFVALSQMLGNGAGQFLIPLKIVQINEGNADLLADHLGDVVVGDKPHDHQNALGRVACLPGLLLGLGQLPFGNQTLGNKNSA